MDMSPVYILVYIYNVGLVAVAHTLHILFCQFRELGISEAVIPRRVQGNMQDGLFRVLVGEEVVVERPKGLLHDTIRIACHIGNHTVSRNDTRGGVIHFLLVVGDCSVERDTPVDFATMSFLLPFPLYQIGILKFTGEHDNPLAQQHQVYRRLFQIA